MCPTRSKRYKACRRCTLRFAMLPPLLEIYVVWHPEDKDGATVADRLIDHFHGTAFSGLIGGEIEVRARSQGWAGPGASPRPLPFVEALPYGIAEAELTVVVPVLGVGLATTVEDDGPWREYIHQLRAKADARPQEICILPALMRTP